MEKIQMVDLFSQHSEIRQEIDSAIKETIDSSAFIKGKAVETFEQNLARYLKVKHVIGCGNGTDALQIALMALELEAGDQVLVPAFTYVATAEVIALLNLVPVMYDVNSRTFNTDSHTSFENIERLITPRTKAIVPVHLFGQCSDMDAVLSVAGKYNLKVVEDCAQALGAKCRIAGCGAGGSIELNGSEDLVERMAGCMGDIGCTSFFPTKNLGGMGDGGALFTNDDTLAEKIRMIANHGQKVKYHHDIIGCNSRLDTIQAAVLNVKLKHLDEYISARKRAATTYTRLLKAFDPLEKCICTPKESEFTTHTYHQYTLIVKDHPRRQEEVLSARDSLKKFLAEKGIPSMIYYPLPLNYQKAFEDIALTKETICSENQSYAQSPKTKDLDSFSSESLRNSEYLAEHVLSLPMHTHLSEEQINFIAETIKEFYA